MLVVNLHDQLTHAALLGSVWFVERADKQTISKHQAFVENGKLLHLQGQSCIALGDEVLKSLHGLWTARRDEFLSLLARILYLQLGSVSMLYAI